MAAAVPRYLLSLLIAADRHPAPQALKVLLGASVLTGAAVYLVLGRAPQKAGHDLASSEKPQAVRGEKLRTVAGEKAAILALEAARAGEGASASAKAMR